MATSRGNRNRPPEDPGHDGQPGPIGASADGEAPSAPSPEEVRAALLPDLVRRALTAGLSGLFNTNEAVRRAVGDAMPREWVDFAVGQSERTRAEFIERLAGELARTLEGLELVEMADRFFEGRTIEVKAQIRLLPREGKLETEGLSVSTPRGRKDS